MTLLQLYRDVVACTRLYSTHWTRTWYHKEGVPVGRPFSIRTQHLHKRRVANPQVQPCALGMPYQVSP